MTTSEEALIRGRLVRWYAQHRRRLPWRRSRDPYRIWVSEVMLQQTRVKTVVPYYQRFIARFGDVARLAAADDHEVLKLWEGLGYYARARNLHRAARQVAADFGGCIPDNWQDLRRLPGVGDYIAAAVLSIAFGQTYAVVDGNVKRVLARLKKMSAPVNRPASHKVYQQIAMELLDASAPGSFNQAVMELGALVCTPRRPDCGKCPLRACCAAFGSGAVDGYPKTVKKKKVPTEHVAIGVVFKQGRVLIVRRPSAGLLGGLWEFPGGAIGEGEAAEAACVRAMAEAVGLEVAVEDHVGRVRHAYTHFKIVQEVFRCRHLAGRVKRAAAVDHRWIPLKRLEAYALHRAHRKFVSQLRL